MRYRKLSPSGDYTFGNSALDFLEDTPEAVGQLVQTRLGLWLGEWFLDIAVGTPYAQGVLGMKSLASVNNTIQQQILGTQGVTDIQNFQSSVDPNTRILTVTCDIDTIYGPTSVDTANQLNL